MTVNLIGLPWPDVRDKQDEISFDVSLWNDHFSIIILSTVVGYVEGNREAQISVLLSNPLISKCAMGESISEEFLSN